MQAFFFYIFAILTVAGALGVVINRNPVSSAFSMIASFIGVAALFILMNAYLIGIIQILVYAGAIMVLFVFVIMILNKPETEPWSPTNLIGKVAIIGILGYFLLRLIMVLWSIAPPAEALQTPGTIAVLGADGVTQEPFGSTRALGNTLFHEFLFPFEAVSLVLLIAIVGSGAVARPHERRPTVMPEGLSAQGIPDNAGCGTSQS